MRTAALLALAGTLVATPALADTTVIHAGAVIVDADSAPRGASTITVTDGRIVSITDGFAPGPADAKTVDLKTKTIAPGMIDLHVHLTVHFTQDDYHSKLVADYANRNSHNIKLVAHRNNQFVQYYIKLVVHFQNLNV